MTKEYEEQMQLFSIVPLFWTSRPFLKRVVAIFLGPDLLLLPRIAVLLLPRLVVLLPLLVGLILALWDGRG